MSTTALSPPYTVTNGSVEFLTDLILSVKTPGSSPVLISLYFGIIVATELETVALFISEGLLSPILFTPVIYILYVLFGERFKIL